MLEKIKSVFSLLFLLLVLPLVFFLSKNIQRYLGKAAFLPANIVIDADGVIGPVNPVWEALAQGGEMEENRQTPVSFSDTIPSLTQLSVKYIRIDHLYDFYQTVSKNPNGSLSFDWSGLDLVVNDILKTGALPFFSLSYMPPAIARGGNITGLPNSWSDWQTVVRETIRHYSGRDQRNLANVYYEVWNEPDLFGNWRIGSSKDYRLLYQYAILGAQQATNVNNFKIGGPATTSPMKLWTSDFLRFVRNNNLRIDFLSWHRYSFSPQQFKQDLSNVDDWLMPYPQYQNLEKIISEWGSDSENNPVHDGYFDALHALAVSRQLIDNVNLAFSFEIKDGPALDKKYWGRWGLFTHQKYQTTPKPRYFALQFLENLKGDRLNLTGEGSDVTGFAVKDQKNAVKTLLINYRNSRSAKQEAVPLKFINLQKGIYSLKENVFLGKVAESTINIATGTFEKTLYLPSDKAVIVELLKIGELATFEPGRFGYQNDKALVLDRNNPAVTLPVNQALPSGTVEFWLKTNFEGALLSEEFFLDIPLNNNFNLMAKKEISGFGTIIKYGLFKEGQSLKDYVSYDIANWKWGQWHFLSFSWQTDNPDSLKLSLFVDGELKQVTVLNQTLTEINNIFVGGYNGSLEELRLSNTVRNPTAYYLSSLIKDENTLVLKHFDSSL